jgi:hypothetical protein
VPDTLPFVCVNAARMFSASNFRSSASVKIRYVADVAAGLCRLGVGDTVGNSMVSRPPSAVMTARPVGQ